MRKKGLGNLFALMIGGGVVEIRGREGVVGGGIDGVRTERSEFTERRGECEERWEI